MEGAVLVALRAAAALLALGGVVAYALLTRDQRLGEAIATWQAAPAPDPEDEKEKEFLVKLTPRERLLRRVPGFFFAPFVSCSAAFVGVSILGLVEGAWANEPATIVPYLAVGLGLMTVTYPRMRGWIQRAEGLIAD